MNDLNLSDREQIMFRTFKKKQETSVEELDKALRLAGEKPRGGSRSLTVSVRYLGYKIAPQGYYIERVSHLGRGNKARYRLHKPRNKRAS